MNTRQVRLSETLGALSGPLARLGGSLRENAEAVLKAQGEKSSHDLLATDVFLQRFQQVTDLSLRKLFPRLLAVLEQSDVRLPFGAVLDRLDGFAVLSDVAWWIALNDLRNRLIHEYAMSDEDRQGELGHAWKAAGRLHDELRRILQDQDLGGRLFYD